ncbi:MAG TPA: serine/threonine-protein kinase, partial [Candidatus Hydrogenedentes bacterium]|nr:serine/threonine-protein kinase [Candidatus Hydrogenedentota bacterium]
MSDDSRELPEKLGRYTIVRVLGKGAMGVVYEGRDPNIGRRVAIKTARGELLGSREDQAELLERFLREARAAGILNHPNIITIYDVGEEDGTAFIAMEYVEGQSLEDHISSRCRFPLAESVELVAQIAEGLACAHDQGIVHRDIK